MRKSQFVGMHFRRWERSMGGGHRCHGHILNCNGVLLWQSSKHSSLLYNHAYLHACLRVKTEVPYILLIHILVIKDGAHPLPESQGRSALWLTHASCLAASETVFSSSSPPLLGSLLLDHGNQVTLVRGKMKGNLWLLLYNPLGKSVPFFQGFNLFTFWTVCQALNFLQVYCSMKLLLA